MAHLDGHAHAEQLAAARAQHPDKDEQACDTICDRRACLGSLAAAQAHVGCRLHMHSHAGVLWGPCRPDCLTHVQSLSAPHPRRPADRTHTLVTAGTRTRRPVRIVARQLSAKPVA